MYPDDFHFGYPKCNQMMICNLISKYDIPRCPETRISQGIVPIFLPTCHSHWERSYYVHPSRLPLWQQACPSLVSWNHFRPCQVPTLTGAVAVASLPCKPATAAGMLPWARGFAILYTTRVAAWMPSLSLGGLFLAVLRHSQNQ
jgi:hypothetical protein